jgi:hypothetical protein
LLPKEGKKYLGTLSLGHRLLGKEAQRVTYRERVRVQHLLRDEKFDVEVDREKIPGLHWTK